MVVKYYIREKLLKDIISGRYLPGEKLPSAKKLAETYEVNVNTISTVLKSLQKEKIIESNRTLEKTVTKNKIFMDSLKKTEGRRISNEFIKNLEKLKISPEQLVEIFKDM